ncbi:MAG: hypothetical protein BIFFINMI_03651 [Phycisphaerae bacterium]|nr:hypothetical protein [Phycisphaerae bacterium]
MPAEEPASPTGGTDVLRWVSLPIRDEPWPKSALLVGLIVLTAVIGALQAAFLGGLALLLMFILLGPYFLPCRYELTERGMKKFFFMFNRDRTWDTYKRYVIQRDGVFLSTYATPSRLDSFRGDFVRFGPGADRDAVIDLIRRRVGTP